MKKLYESLDDEHVAQSCQALKNIIAEHVEYVQKDANANRIRGERIIFATMLASVQRHFVTLNGN
jgi:hypothetical protein